MVVGDMTGAKDEDRKALYPDAYFVNESIRKRVTNNIDAIVN